MNRLWAVLGVAILGAVLGIVGGHVLVGALWVLASAVVGIVLGGVVGALLYLGGRDA